MIVRMEWYGKNEGRRKCISAGEARKEDNMDTITCSILSFMGIISVLLTSLISFHLIYIFFPYVLGDHRFMTLTNVSVKQWSLMMPFGVSSERNLYLWILVRSKRTERTFPFDNSQLKIIMSLSFLIFHYDIHFFENLFRKIPWVKDLLTSFLYFIFLSSLLLPAWFDLCMYFSFNVMLNVWTCHTLDIHLPFHRVTWQVRLLPDALHEFS